MSEGFRLVLTFKDLYQHANPPEDGLSDIKLSLFALAEPDHIGVDFDSAELDTDRKVTLAFNSSTDAEKVRKQLANDPVFTKYFDIPDQAEPFQHNG